MNRHGKPSQGYIAKPGYPFIAASGAGGVLAWLLGWEWLAVLAGLAALFFLYFFRDPERNGPTDPAVLVSPADGRVIRVDEVQEDRFLRGPARRVAIFMNVFDVHVNRSPVAGLVQAAEHKNGRFLAAFREEAEAANEQQATLLATDHGQPVLVVQIAGVLARRIIPFRQPGDRLAKGERLGIICFGSRVDVYLPPGCQITVKRGDRVKAGVSVMARWPEGEALRGSADL
ncbi:MAG: phosphatidylserine decarboxylase family protein [Deltaproteobacteria bacterium]|nr:phosphatidylserine decarboxylase family protein [Deltaproteobacteria bacterium]